MALNYSPANFTPNPAASSSTTNPFTIPGLASTNPKANVAVSNPNTAPASSLTADQLAARAGVPASQIVKGADGALSVGPAPSNISNQSTTTLSSNKTADISGIKSTTDNLGKTGLSTDTNSGVTTSANGNVYNPPATVTGAQQNPDGSTTTTYSDGTSKVTVSPGGTTPTGGYNGDTYVTPGSPVPRDANGNPVTLTDNPPSAQKQLDGYQNLMAQADALTASLIAATKASYEGLIKQQEQSNISSQGALRTFLYKSGSLQSTQSGQGALQSQLAYGLQQISKLQGQENMALIQAQQAGINQDFQFQDKMNTIVNNLRTEKQAAITKQNDSILAATQKLSDEQFQVQEATNKSIADVATTAAGNNAPPEIQAKIAAAKTPQEAIAAAGSYLASATGQLGDYYQYMRTAEMNGQTPEDYNTWKAKDDAQAEALKEKSAYGTAFAAAKGKAAGEAAAAGGGNTLTSPVTSYTGATNGLTYNAPASIAPYVNFSNNGVKYVDLSNLTASDRDKLAPIAQQAGFKVITNANQAVDVKNITDASSKLDTMKAAFEDTSTANAASRNTWQAAWMSAAKLLQTNPDAASNDVYVAAALDILKALSGTQGFRGGASMVQTVESIFPKVTDTKAVVDQKIDKLQGLINDRETALVGKPSSSDQVLIDNQKANNTITDYVTNNKGQADTVAGLYVSGATDSDVLSYMQKHPDVFNLTPPDTNQSSGSTPFVGGWLGHLLGKN